MDITSDGADVTLMEDWHDVIDVCLSVCLRLSAWNAVHCGAQGRCRGL